MYWIAIGLAVVCFICALVEIMKDEFLWGLVWTLLAAGLIFAAGGVGGL